MEKDNSPIATKLKHFIFKGQRIPENTQGAIIRWVDYGILPGSFLTAVLENDLMGAVKKADRENLENLEAIVEFIEYEVPSGCRGGPKEVAEWKRSFE